MFHGVGLISDNISFAFGVPKTNRNEIILIVSSKPFDGDLAALSVIVPFSFF